MKRLLISASLIAALTGNAFAAATNTPTASETTFIWDAVSKSQMSLTLPADSALANPEQFKTFLAAAPEKSIQIRGFQLTSKPEGAELSMEFSNPHLEKLNQTMKPLQVNITLPTVARAQQVLEALEPNKTNTNADIIMLKQLLLDANIPSRYRVSELDGKLHYSLIANIDGIQYNIDMANWLVPDQIMTNQGYVFKYDNWHLEAPAAIGNRTTHKNNFAYFAQTNSAWKLTRFSYSNIARTGCGPVAATMIFNYLTPETVDVTPPSVIKLAKDKDLDLIATPRVHMPKLLAQLSQQYDIPYQTLKTFDERYLPDPQLHAKVASTVVKNQVATEIRSGKLVLVATLLNSELRYTSGTEHFLVVKDFVNGKAIVYDPLPSHTFYEPLPSALQEKYSGYCYQVPVEVLLKNMTQAYSFEQ